MEWISGIAAIKLQVPDSGIEWLDAMITRANRDKFAGQAMQHFFFAGSPESRAKWAYKEADAMIKQGEAGISTNESMK